MGIFKKERAAVVNATEAVMDGTSAVRLGLFVVGAIAVSALVLALVVKR